MERISFGGRAVQGFALGQSSGGRSGPPVEAIAAVSVGATAGLLAYVFKAPLWGSLLAGTGAAFLTKVGIDQASSA